MNANPTSSRSLHRIELILLCLFCFALPLEEAPKNIFFVLFSAIWFYRSIRLHNWGYLERSWNYVLGGFFAAALLSVVCSTPYPHKWSELRDIACYLLTGWMLARTTLARLERLAIITCLVVATIIGIAHGYWLMTHQVKIFLELHSVGQVNHSALYAMGVAALAAALAITARNQMARMQAGIAITVAFALVPGLMLFESRGAIIAYLVTAAVIVAPIARCRGIRLTPVILIVLVLIAGELAWNRSIIQKTADNLRIAGLLTSRRVEAVNSSIEYWRHSPITGVGAANFNAVSPEMVRNWVEARGETFNEDNYLFSSHAHNLYFNTLAERGVIGEAALWVLMFAWLRSLWRYRPRAGQQDEQWLSWGAGVAGFGLVFVGGVFNTTLHHEHGMLAMLCLGMHLSTTERA